VFFSNDRGIRSAEIQQKRSNGCNIKSSQSIDLSVAMDPRPAQPSAFRGMGTDIALLDSAYLLSQVVPSLFMGSIVQFFSVTAYMACASLLSVVAVYFSSKIIFEKVDIDASR